MKKLTLTTFITLAAFVSIFGQTTEKTKNTLDQSLRSTARVNPSTLAMEMSIPIANYPGRNGHSLPLVLNYTSKLWRLELSGSGYQGGSGEYTTNIPKYAEKSAAGWTSSFGVAIIEPDLGLYDCNGKSIGEEANPQVPLPSGCSTIYYMKRVRVKLPDGSNIELRLNDNLYSGSFGISDYYGTYLSTDGTKARLEFGSTSILYMSDGSRYFFGTDMRGTKYQDESGNEIYFTGSTKTWSDTMGRTLVSPLPLNLGIDEQSQTVGSHEFTIPGLSEGEDLSYVVVWKELDDSGVLLDSESLAYTGDKACPSGSVNSNFLFQGGISTRICQSTTTFNPVVMHELILPNGAKYKFQYNKYGEITKIHYPTGGYERFAYAQIATLSYRTDVIYERTNRGVTDRWVRESSSADELHWKYDAIKTTNLLRIKTTAPDGVTITDNATETNWANDFPSDKIKWGFDNPAAGRPYDEKVYSGTTLYSRKLTEYEYSGYLSGGWGDATRDARVKRTISIIFEPGNSYALASMTDVTYDTGTSYDASYFPSLNAVTTTTYDYVAIASSTASGTITPASAAGWFSGATPAVVNKNVYLYDANYKARNVNGLVTESRVEDASGNVKAKTQYLYDQNQLVDANTSTRWENPVPGYTYQYRALLSSTRSYYDIANGLYVQNNAQYDKMGNLRYSWDNNGNLSEIQYSSTYDYAYPTSTITPVPDSSGTYGSITAFTTTTTYDYNTGLPVTVTDPNGAVTAMEYDDPLLRPTKVTIGYGTSLAAQTATEYGSPDSSGQYPAAQRFVKVKSQIDSTNWKEGYTWADGLGRTIRSQSVDAETGDVFTMTCYDSMGRVSKATNPFRGYSSQTCSTTSGLDWTTNTYDDAGRLWKVTTPDSAVVETTYGLVTSGSEIGESETVIDESGKVRRTVKDASENLIRVDEPDQYGSLGTSGSPNQKTVYSYDLKDNLTQITQGGQTRSFSYDSLDRLTQATNPESGTFQYTYDANGNLAVKTDARGITTTHTYDRLNRVTLKDYSGTTTPDVTYFYDSTSVSNSKGKLTKVSSTSSENLIVSYDLVGNITGSQQVTDGNTYSFSYTYNLDNDLLTQTYPSGKVVQFDYDSNGELSKVSRQSSSSSFTYANSFSYAPSGEVEKMRFGNARWETTQFNSRRQITQIGLGYSASDTGLWKANYEYGDWSGSTIDAQKNNGNVARQTIGVPAIGGVSGFTAIQSYTYDPLDRLKSAAETISGTQTWKQTFVYDRFGNRNFDTGNTSLQSVDSTTVKVVNPEILTTNNRFKLDQDNDSVNDYLYDSTGNLTKNAQGREFTYNAENLQTTASASGLSMTYAYDGNNKRVKSYDSTNDRTTIFVYDANGNPAAEYTINVTQPSAPVISYLTEDALGSPRAISDSFGDVKARRDFLPYGEEIYAGVASRNSTQKYSSTTDNTRIKFATYQNDGETGLDFAQSRYYSPMHGRFTSPDEFKGGPDELFDFEDDASSNPTFYADLTNPQSINKYQYGYNNPYKFNDSTGHCPPCSPAQFFLPVVTVDVEFIEPTFVRPTFRPLPMPEILPTITRIGSAVRSSVRPYTATATSDLLPTYTPMPIFRPGRSATSSNGREASVRARPRPNNARPPRIKPDTQAKGPHTRFARDSSGRVRRYTTYRPNGRGGWEPKKSVDTKPGGDPHFNKKTGQRVPTPHTQGKRVPGGVRPARTNELPK